MDGTTSVQTGLREKAALQLAGLDVENPHSKERFTEMVASGELRFPLLASMRIHVQKKAVKLSTSAAAGPAGSNTTVGAQSPVSEQVSAIIVEAMEQDPSTKPNKAYMGLLAYVTECSPHADRILPATLAAIQ